MASKRKAPASVGYSDSKGEEANKRSATAALKKEANTNGAKTPEFDHSRPEERYGIVQREFYPPEMSNERCAMYNNNEIPRPIEVLQQTIKNTQAARDGIQVGEAVVHWFKRDLRTYDNRGLRLASEKAKSKGVPLI
ncbi:hypothetical protein LTS18_014282, partial [Coniosporium uncinatum]